MKSIARWVSGPKFSLVFVVVTILWLLCVRTFDIGLAWGILGWLSVGVGAAIADRLLEAYGDRP